MFNYAKFMPLVSKLSTLLQDAASHYAVSRNAGVEGLTSFLLSEMDGWEPKFNGKSLLDKQTRAAGARFLAGITVNYMGD